MYSKKRAKPKQFIFRVFLSKFEGFVKRYIMSNGFAVKISSAVVGFALLVLPSRAETGDYEKALELFSYGMYENARALFEKCDDELLSRDYVVLCALRTKSPDATYLVKSSEENGVKSILYSKIHREFGLLLFDEGNYAQALEELSKASYKDLSDNEAGEYWYKKGYCLYNTDSFDESRVCFTKSAEYNTEYTFPAYFALGMLEYNYRNFPVAQGWFERSVSDPRFADISSFYLVDCHFMAKDYDYVIKQGEKLYPQMPEARQKYLSRMLSESFMVKGDAVSARKYLTTGGKMSNSDFFHAGSVLYAVGDYRGAIQNFEKMGQLRDSLFQIASYQKAYSYIKIKNKVKAMESFKDASLLSFDENIEEDAMFNYAKLSFDLNGDETAFNAYISKYGTSKKGELIYDYLAMSALLKRDYERAVLAYDQIEELSADQKSNYIKANFLRAKKLLDIGAYATAIPYLKASAYYLGKDDEFGQLCRYELANTYYITDDYKDALTIYNDLYNLSALDTRDEGALVSYNIAYCFFKQSDYANASRWFDIYVSSGNALAREDALIRRADCDFAQRNYRSAAEKYKVAVSEFPSTDNLYPYYYMGTAYGLYGNKKERIEALSSALGANSDVPFYCATMYELGRAYSDVSDNVNALKVFDLLLSRTSDADYVAKALMGKGAVKRNSGDLKGALADYQGLVKKMPESPYTQDALLSIQSIYTAMKQPEKYIEYLEANNLSLGRNESERQELYYATAEQVFLAGNYSGAIASFNKFLSMYPKSSHVADSYYYMAASYKTMGQKERACEYYNKSFNAGLSGSFKEFALMDYAMLSFSLENYLAAYETYTELSLAKYTMISKVDVYKGAMRSAYRAQLYDKAIDAASFVMKLTSSEDLLREAQFLQAKSYLYTSQRDKAFPILGKLISQANTPEGAESYYLIIQARYDWGKFDEVEKGVFDFTQKCTDQPYWLAKAFIVLGDSYVERNMIQQAVATYQSVADGYVASNEGDDIQQIISVKLSQL